MASLSQDGSPQVRPVTLMFDDGRFYFATSRTSDKAAQILRDDRLEFVTVFSEGGYSGYLRVCGHGQVISDREVVERVTTQHEYPVREYWTGLDDPDFFFFRVAPTRVQYLKPGDERAVEVTDEFIS